MQYDEHHNYQDQGDFSTIRFFQRIQERLAECDVYPLTTDNLIIDVDEYALIGGEDETGAPFAYLGIDHPRSHRDLLFGFEFFATGYVVSMDRQAGLFYHYHHMADDEVAAADIVFGLLTTIANGQIGILCSQTEDDDRVQAVEILYRPKGEHHYHAVRTYPLYQSRQRLVGREWTTLLMRGQADIADVDVNGEALISWTLDTQGSEKTRGVVRDLGVPLMRDDWHRISGGVAPAGSPLTRLSRLWHR